MNAYSDTKKYFIASNLIIFFGYCSAIFAVCYVKINSRLNISFFELIIGWVPLVALVIICFFYSFIVNAPKYQALRKLIFSSVLLLSAAVITVFLPVKYNEIISTRIQGTALALFGITNMVLNYRIESFLLKTNFSFYQETQMMEKVHSRMDLYRDKKNNNLLNRLSYAFVVPFIVQPNNMVFAITTLVIAFVVLCVLLRMYKDYKKAQSITKVKPVLLLINFVLSITIGIVLYSVIDFKLPAFISIYSSILGKAVIDDKIALYLYDQISNQGTVVRRYGA